MGSAISSLFGMNQSYEAPDPVEYDPAPTRDGVEPEKQALRDDERRKLKARRGMNGNLLTSPLGTTGGNASSGLLGRI